MRKLLSSITLLTLATVAIVAQGRGTPSTLQIKVDANGYILAATATQTNPVNTVLFNNARLAVDADGNLMFVCVDGCGSGGGGAPTNAEYWVGAANGSLSAEKNLGALTTGLVFNTAGVPTTYAGAALATDVNIGATQTYQINSVDIFKAQTALDNYYGGHSGNLTGSGGKNTAFGFEAGLQQTEGGQNTFIGYASGTSNTSGTNNTAVGKGSLSLNATATDNVAIGTNAMFDGRGAGGNVAIGVNALFSANTGVTETVAIGKESLTGLTSGQRNTAVGRTTGQDMTEGQTNICIGFIACSGIITGSYNTIIGSDMSPLSDTLSGNIILADGHGNIRAQHDSSGWTFNGYIGLVRALWYGAAPDTPVACTSPTVTWNNGTAIFQIDIGSSCTGIKTLSFNLPSTTNGWMCNGINVSNPATSNPSQSASSATSVTLTNYSRTTGLSADWTAGDDVRITCTAG